MAYTLITNRDSPNFGYNKGGKTRGVHGRPSGKASFIVLHHWGKEGQQFNNVVDYLCRPNGDTSAHYVVEAGRVACIVDPDDVAWHAKSGNAQGIGIECRPECTPADMETVAELIADIRKHYGNLPIYPHSKFVVTACPGKWANKIDTINKRAQQHTATSNKGATVENKPDAQGLVNVYRLYNPKNGDRLWTTDANEINTLVKNGWKNEGVAFRSFKK